MLTSGTEHRDDPTPTPSSTPPASPRSHDFPPDSPPQELEFASRLVKQSQVSTEVLLEALRLLLPTLPESELLSVVDALCRPKHSLPSASMEQARPGYASVLTVLVKEPVNPKPFNLNVVMFVIRSSTKLSMPFRPWNKIETVIERKQEQNPSFGPIPAKRVFH